MLRKFKKNLFFTPNKSNLYEINEKKVIYKIIYIKQKNIKKVNTLFYSKYSINNNDDLETFDKNLLYKKLDQEYLNKLSFLLSYNDKKYVKKRNNINELQYKMDNNNNLYLTKSSYSNQNNIKEDEKSSYFSQNINLLKINNPNSKKIQDLIPGFKNKEIQSIELYNNNLSYNEYYNINKAPIENENEKKRIFYLLKNNEKLEKNSHSQKNFHILYMDNSFQINKNSSSNNSILNENSLSNTTRKNFYNGKYSFKNISIIDNIHKLSEKYKLIREYKSKIKKMDFINLFSFNKSKWNQNNKNFNFKFKRNLKINQFETKRGFLPNMFLRNDNSIELIKNKKNLSVDDINNKLIKNKNKIILEKSKEKILSKEEIFEKIKLGTKYLEQMVKNTNKIINGKLISKKSIINKKNLKYNFFHKSLSLISKK